MEKQFGCLCLSMVEIMAITLEDPPLIFKLLIPFPIICLTVRLLEEPPITISNSAPNVKQIKCSSPFIYIGSTTVEKQ